MGTSWSGYPGFCRWTTTAEQVGGKTYIYYDFPNDQDPHLFIDGDLTDGKPGKNMGLAFADPSDGSDCAVVILMGIPSFTKTGAPFVRENILGTLLCRTFCKPEWNASL